MSSDSEDYLKATTETIFESCPRFRILVAGKAGSGKSSLINRTFSVNIAAVSHLVPGTSDIEAEIYSDANARFVLHDSEGYEYGDINKFNALEQFIIRRSAMSNLGERLHAVWLCTEAPIANGRFEAGDERLLEVCKQVSVPVVLVYTKYDLFVAAKEYDILDQFPDLKDMSEGAVNAILQQGAQESFDQQLSKDIGENRIQDMPPYVNVSIRDEYLPTLSTLVEVTINRIAEMIRPADGEVLELIDESETSTIQPYTSLVLAMAQRVQPDIKIKASIAVGRAKYWRGLASSLHFPGKTLKACLHALHTDIIGVWNFCDTGELLLDDAFQANISQLSKDLADPAPSNPNTHAIAGFSAVGPIAGIVGAVAAGAVHVVVPIVVAVVFAYWVYEVYAQTPNIVRCLMAYIVDTTNIMQSIFWLTQDAEEPLSKEVIAVAVQAYEVSAVKHKVHNDIRTFMKDRKVFQVMQRDKVLDKMVSLIKENRFYPENRFFKAAQKARRSGQGD